VQGDKTLQHKRLSPSKFLLVIIVFLMTGCGQKNNALSTPQGQALLKTQTIVNQSGGDWNKLSPADQQYLVSGAGGGTIQGAKSFLATAAARQSFHPGPPPTIPTRRPTAVTKMGNPGQ
jgi:hypothetical protein